jgi:hypothetical protein
MLLIFELSATSHFLRHRPFGMENHGRIDSSLYLEPIQQLKIDIVTTGTD